MNERPTVQGLTVDTARARDLDDAFWVEPTAAGYRLAASVVDLTDLIPVGSIDDHIAAARGRTVYGAAVPKEAMLSQRIAQGLASLLPGRARPVVACVLDFDGEGRMLARDFLRATLRSRTRLSHETFDEILERGEGPLAPVVVAAVDLARILWRQRIAVAGPPDWEAAFGPDGATREGVPPGLIAQTVVHEFMVAANACATEFVRARGMPMIYRNQGPRAGGPNGRYEIVCHGHANLGKSAYGQFGSPIRRFTDLVNQRILCAAIEGAPAPYDIPELTRICAISNRVAQRAERIGRTGEELPAERPRPGRPPIDRLDASGFRQLLERAGGLDGQARRELGRRVTDGLLTHSDVAWLLFGANSPADDGLKAGLLRLLAGNPEEMARIWEAAASEQGLPMFEARVRPHGGRWIAAVAAGAQAGNARDADPLRARGLAALRLAAAIVGVEPPGDPLPPGEGLRMADMHSRAKLVALCRMMSWDGPEYAVEGRGTVPCRHYSGTVTVGVDGFDYESPLVHASTRRGAEAAAAALALAALDPYADDLLKRDAKAYGIDLTLLDGDEAERRPLSAISEFCRRYRAGQRIVWLTESPSTGWFECMMEISAGGNTLRARGVGGARTEAMEASAREAIASILEHGQRRGRRRDAAEAGREAATPAAMAVA